MHEDHEQVTPPEPRVGEVPQPLPVADQFVLNLGGVLVDQVDEPMNSPRLVSIAA